MHIVVICFNSCTFQCFSARKSPNLGMFQREYNPYHCRANRAQSKWHGMLYSVLGLLQRCVQDRVSRNKRAVSDSTLRYQKPVRIFTLRNEENAGISSFHAGLQSCFKHFCPNNTMNGIDAYEEHIPRSFKNIGKGRYLYQRVM